MNLLGAPASRRPVGRRKPELAGETPALPGTAPRFRGSKRECFQGILTPALSSLREAREKMVAVRKHLFLLLFFGKKARPKPGYGMSENHAENHNDQPREHQVKRRGAQPGFEQFPLLPKKYPIRM